jgi:hypothetical protein
MITLFLLVLGIGLMFNSMPVLGLTSVVVAIMLGRTCEKIWCVVLGLCLLCTPWWPAAAVSIIIGILTPVPDPNRPSLHNITF